jgi:uncharacterized membrane protein
MAILGIVIGLLLGAAFESFKGAMFLAALGAFIGHLISRNGGQVSSTSKLAVLETKIKTMQDQMLRMAQRITELETRWGANPSASSTNVSATAPSPSTALATPATQVAEHKIEPVIEKPAAVTSAPLKTTSSNPTLSVPVATPATATTRPASPPPARPAAQKPAVKAPPRKPAEPNWLQLFIQRWVIGGNPIVKIGVLILFLGLAFLLRYVAENTVVPIELRYAGVAATGIGLLLFGWRWRHKKDNYGVILQGAGIGVLYLTTLAGMKLHPLIPMQFGFAILFGVAAFAALLAILQDALALAIVAALGGFAAPVLASTGSAHHSAFFTYLTLINLGIVAIAWFKTWRVLNLIGFVCSFVLAAAWGDKYYTPELFGTAEPFLLLLFALYVFITFLFARRTLGQNSSGATNANGFEEHARQVASHVSYVDGTLAFGVPLTTFGLQYLLVKHFENGAAFSALGFGLVYILYAFALFRKTGMRYALLNETMIALAVIFGSLSIPLGLEQKWTSAAWALEAAGVYWVGIRQSRVHARLFALLLLFGSGLYFALGLHIGAEEAVLDGSLLGSAMLALSLWFVYALLRRADAQQLHAFERATRGLMVAFGALFIALMPFLVWPLDWASTALAILGTVAVFAAQRLSERSLMYWGCGYQAVAGALFMTTLRGASNGSALGNGWTGLLAASLIGASMLAGVWAMARHVGAQTREGTALKVSGVASLTMLAGLAFINLAPLFVLPLRIAAMIWPLTGIATLWWAVRAKHVGALMFALVLQVLAGLVYFGSWIFLYSSRLDLTAAKPFLYTGFWGPILIAIAALICAGLLQRKQSGKVDMTLGWIALFWSGAWWAFAWAEEIFRAFRDDKAYAAIIGITIATAGLWSIIAKRRAWIQLGQATLVFVPALILILAAELHSELFHPMESWCALAWPLALVMHIVLVKRQQGWLKQALLDLAHTVGAWLFVVLAAIELRWQFAHWTSTESAWPLLGWMIAPVAYLWCMTSSALRSRWPLRAHFNAYVIVSAIPMVAYLLLWVWVTNAVSNGTAAPLPYVPLLNPLELAQFAVLIGATLWWWQLKQHESFQAIAVPFTAVIGATTLFVITGMVMRTCHHWGGVAWQIDALLDSTLVQTSLSIVWSLIAIGLMLFGNRNRFRWVWIVGAGMIAIVVAKLFLVELAAKGSLARIVSFIVVGMLLLLVGYFAPLPPRRTTDSGNSSSAQPEGSTPA